MGNYSFSVMPSVNISRSRFERKSQHKTSFNLGNIIPIYLEEVLPGDTHSLDMAALVRMSTPIAPIMDNIYLDFFAFFVPNRLTWIHWKEFMGENSVSAGIPQVSYSIPYINNSLAIGVGSYGDYFGLPTGKANLLSNNKVSALPFRALALIYNRWFRNQNVIAPLAVDTSDANHIFVSNNDSLAYDASKILIASKLPDYFTKSLPYAQKGSPVSIPLGTTAPIIVNPSLAASNTPKLAKVNGNLPSNPVVFGTNGNAFDDDSGDHLILVPNNSLVANLSQATAATINQLRYAFQLQKMLEKDALYGTRYWEILAAHFGVSAPDASLQDPEYLGGARMQINVDQVLSTAGYSPDSQSTVGAPGANSVSGFKGSIFTKSFVEHGYLIIVAVARHDQTYGQGVERLWTRQTREQFYLPVFANLGAQEVFLKEIYATGNTSNDNTRFGYQEAWAEYRYKRSYATALLNPNSANSLDFWTLGNKFAAAPTLGQTFIEQDRNAIARALVTGNNGPDFIADFFFKDIAVRPMPVYSIPGLIDHH